VVKFYKEYSLSMAKKQREEEAHLRSQLAEAMEALQLEPDNLQHQGRLSELGERLNLVEKKYVEGLKVRNWICWKKVGDACSKEFFQAHKDRGSGANISKLVDENGASYTAQRELERVCSEYYANLYAIPSPSLERSAAQIHCFEGILDRLTASMKFSLEADITLVELKAALKGMDPAKPLVRMV